MKLNLNPAHGYFALLCMIGIYLGIFDPMIYQNNIWMLFGFTTILAISSVCTNYLIKKFYSENVIASNMSMSNVLLISIFFPVVEEYLFRHAGRHDLESLIGSYYTMHTISIFFGLIHASNYWVSKYSFNNNNKSLLIEISSQVLHTMAFGYISFQANSLMYCILLHSYYNTFVTILFYILATDQGSIPITDHEIHVPSISDAVYLPKRRHSFPNIVHPYIDNCKYVQVTEKLREEHCSFSDFQLKITLEKMKNELKEMKSKN